MAREVPDIPLNNGVEMPSIGLGVFQTPPDETRSAVAAALDTGYRHIDTAAAYGNEREVGEAVRASKGGGAAVFLETKISLEAYRALERLLKDGKVRAIGVSNFMVEHLTNLLDEADVVPAVNQIELHPYFQ
jgi:diketogulonate reductase-like aldo/keto reductase